MSNKFDIKHHIIINKKNPLHVMIVVYRNHAKNLFLARQNSMAAYCCCFVESGASLNLRGSSGTTALDQAYERGFYDKYSSHPRIIEMLRRAGD